MHFFLFLPALALAFFSAAAHAADPLPTPSPPVDFQHLPWADGESLTYHVSWTGLDAANGTFVAHWKGDHWEFTLGLVSDGLVQKIYPFVSSFWSVTAPGQWRSSQYGEFRFEPKRTIKEQTTIDYAAHQGHRENWIDGKVKTFPVVEDAVDDIGTMLYHLRTGAWKPGDHRTIYVYESDSEKQAEAECQARETKALGTWPAQPLLRLYVLPTVGTHRRGHLMLWMTDDARRLPLHAEISFKYGTFVIDLVRAGSSAGKKP